MLLAILGLGFLVPGVQAQTAHFGYAQVTVANHLASASAVAVDSSGNVYIADSGNHTVTKEVLSGGSYTPSTVVSGLNSPVGIAVDTRGNVYIADSGNQEILKETPSGGSYTQSVVANSINNGLKTPVSVAVDASGNVYIADSGNQEVFKETLSGGTYTQSVVANATTNGLKTPVGVAVGASGNVYIADSGNQEVFKETLSAGIYTQSVVANSVTNGLNAPVGVAVDGGGSVYIADSGVQEILKETLSGSYTQSVVASAADNGLSSPVGVAVDTSNDVYIADSGTSSVLKLSLSGVDFGSVPVGTAATPIPVTFTFDTGGTIANPSVLTMGAANLDFTDAGTGTCVTNGTTYSYSAGATCTVDVIFKPTKAGLRKGAVVLTSSGGATIATAYVFGTGNGPEVSFAPPTQSTLGGGFNKPVSLAIDGSGNIYVADSGSGSVEELPPGCASASCATQMGGGFKAPFGVAVDGAGNIYVADEGNSIVDVMPQGCTATKYSGGGCTVTQLGGGFSGTTGVAVDGSGNVYVANYGNNLVQEMPAGCTSTRYQNGSCSTTTLGGGFTKPFGVAVDDSGNMYVADYGNQQVKEVPAGCTSTKYSAGGCAITQLGGGFSGPTGIALDPAGNLYVADFSGASVWEVPPGCTSAKYTSGGCSVTKLGSGFSEPSDVEVDNQGNIYIADYQSYLVSEIDRADASSLSFQSTAVGQTSSDSPQTVTLTNIGNQTLSFPIPAVAGSNNPSVSSNFLYDSSSTCQQNSASASTPYTVASNASCTLAINFAPVTAGSISGTAVLTDNNQNASSPTYATQTITLNGTATAVVPGAPTIGTAVAGSAQATISFTPPTFTGGAPITSYTATSSPGGITGTCTASPCTVTGLTNGTTYTFTVAATNSAGTGPASAPSNAVTPTDTQTITFNNPGPQIYGASPTITATSSSGLTVTLTSATTSVCTVTSAGVLTTVSIGTCTIDANQAGDSSYVAAKQVAQSFAVNPASLTVTVNNAMRAYGAANPTFTGTVTGLKNGDTAASIGVAYSTTAIAGSPVGTYPITATITSKNYTLTVTAGTLTVTAAPLSITVSNATRAYGAANPAFTGTVTGLLNGDTAASIGVAYSTTATAGSPVGTYPITATVTSKNYTLTVTPGTLTVTAAPLSITVNNATRAYGAANPAFTGTVTGLKNGDTAASIGVAYSTTATAGSPVGTYPITATVTSKNYTLTVMPGTLTVTGATLVVSANNVTKVYGATNPTFTGTVTGAVNGDTFTESFSTTATATSGVGQYPIVPSVTGADLSDYTVTEHDGTLTVVKAGSAVSLSSSTSTANLNANVTFTATVTSLTTGMPTGSVEFLDGSTVLGSSTLNSADTATFTTNSLTSGLRKITAVYSGDANFSGATSAALAEIIASADFSLMVNPASVTLKPGQSGVLTVDFVPMGGFKGTATFSCSGVPTGATCKFSPVQVSADGSNTKQSTQLTITTMGTSKGTVAMIHSGANGGGTLLAGIFWLPGLFFGGFLFWQRRRLNATHRQLLTMVLLVTVVAAMAGCGFPPPNMNPGTSTITVTATTSGSSGSSITHSATFSLTVQ